MQDIVSEIKNGSREAFRKLFEDYYPVLCSYAQKYLPGDERCKDVVQDVLLKYWENRKDFTSLSELRPFLYTAVKNQSLNLLKREQVGERYIQSVIRENEVEFFEEDMMEHEIFRMLYHAVDSLPGQMRKIIEYSMHGLRNAEIAQKMGIADGTLHTLKKLAYRKLREQLKGKFIFLLFF